MACSQDTLLSHTYQGTINSVTLLLGMGREEQMLTQWLNGVKPRLLLLIQVNAQWRVWSQYDTSRGSAKGSRMLEEFKPSISCTDAINHISPFKWKANVREQSPQLGWVLFKYSTQDQGHTKLLPEHRYSLFLRDFTTQRGSSVGFTALTAPVETH